MSSPAPIILYGDPEHDSLRMVIPLILLVGLGLGFGLFMTLLPRLFGGGAGQFTILSICGAVPVGLLLMKLADVVLKRMWHSGREIHLTATEICFQEPNTAARCFPLDESTQIGRWCFKFEPYARIGRERQIKNGWYCFAVQLQYDGRRLIAHTFLNPRQAAAQLSQAPFHTLDMGKIYEISMTNRLQQFWAPSGRPELPASLIVGENGRYWMAERNRWEEGVELAAEDFATLIKSLPKSNKMKISNE